MISPSEDNLLAAGNVPSPKTQDSLREKIKSKEDNPPAAGTVPPPKTEDSLREKIKSKMETAKLLGGAVGAGLGWLLTLMFDETRFGSLCPDSKVALMVAVALLFCAGCLYLRTMYSYDNLLMPDHFWGSGRPGRRPPRWLVARPPSSATWVLYQNMMHIWNWQFTPATFSAAFGLLALAYAAGRQLLQPVAHPFITVAVIVTLLLLFFFFYITGRPRVGAHD